MALMTATDYAKLSNKELLRRYQSLQRDTSCYTMEAEMARMFALQEIGDVLFNRQSA